MTKFLAIQPYGILLLDEKGNILAKAGFPKDPERIAKILEERSLLEGFLDKLKFGADDGIVVNDERLKELLESRGVASRLAPNEGPLKELMRSPHKFASTIWGGVKLKEYLQLLNEIGVEFTKERIRKELSSVDNQVMKAIDYIDHVNKALNILAPAIREWYLIHFPELGDLVDDHVTFMKIIAAEPDRRKITREKLREIGLDDKKIEQILTAARESMGAEFNEEDLESLRHLAERWLALYESRRRVEEQIEQLMRRAAPNLSAVVHPLVGARLIAVAGGLERLASLPASSIQILGAHKAIFMHLTKGTKPPKHGILFQAKEVRNAPKKLRGKIARLLATKIAIAARVDLFGGGRYVGDKLRKEIDEKLSEILGGKAK